MVKVVDEIERLSLLVDLVPGKLKLMDPDGFNLQPWLGMWSKNQILGYLIDLTAVTHQRIIRMQYDRNPAVIYIRRQWVLLQNYNVAETDDLIQLWKWNNKHLLHIIRNIPLDRQDTEIVAGNGYSLSSLIKNYLDQIEHQLTKKSGE